MSGPDPPYDPLKAAVTKQAVEASYDRLPDFEVKKYLLKIVAEIDFILSATNAAGKKSDDPNTATLQVLSHRLEKGYHSPSYGLPDVSVPPGNRSLLRTKTKDSMSRPLGDYEDLYYSLLATIKEMHSEVMTRMKMLFLSPDTPVLPEKGYTLKSLATWLYEQWDQVNKPAFVRALNDAIKVGYEYGLQFEELSGEPKTSLMRERKANIAQEIGLSYVGNGHPAMINGKLNEKYRLLLKVQKVAPVKPKRLAKKQRTAKKFNEGLKGQFSNKNREHGDEQAEQQSQGAVQDQPQAYAMNTGDILSYNERKGERPDLWQQQLRVEHNNQVKPPVQRDQSPEQDYAPPYGFINWASPITAEDDEDAKLCTQFDKDVVMTTMQCEDHADMAMDLDPNDFPSAENLAADASQYNLQVLADHQSRLYQELQNFEGELSGWPAGTVHGASMPVMDGVPIFQQQVSIYTNWANEILREHDIQDQSVVPSKQPHPGAFPAQFVDHGGHDGQPGASPAQFVDPGGQPGTFPTLFADHVGPPGASHVQFVDHGGHGGQPGASPGMTVDPGGQAIASPNMIGDHVGWAAGDMNYMM